MGPRKGRRNPWKENRETKETTENQEGKKKHEASKKSPKKCMPIIEKGHFGRVSFREVLSSRRFACFYKMSEQQKRPKKRPPVRSGQTFGVILGPSGAARAPWGEPNEDPRADQRGFLSR